MPEAVAQRTQHRNNPAPLESYWTSIARLTRHDNRTSHQTVRDPERLAGFLPRVRAWGTNLNQLFPQLSCAGTDLFHLLSATRNRSRQRPQGGPSLPLKSRGKGSKEGPKRKKGLPGDRFRKRCSVSPPPWGVGLCRAVAGRTPPSDRTGRASGPDAGQTVGHWRSGPKRQGGHLGTSGAT